MKIHKKLKEIFPLIAGIFFILAGIVGLALPFLQGILFIVIGIIFLSVWSPRVRVLLDKHTARYPKLNKLVSEIEKRLKW